MLQVGKDCAVLEPKTKEEINGGYSNKKRMVEFVPRFVLRL
jgi:hypothetical protein